MVTPRLFPVIASKACPQEVIKRWLGVSTSPAGLQVVMRLLSICIVSGLKISMLPVLFAFAGTAW